MFERFTEEARQVVVLAQEEARGLRHNYIGTEHILLGLLRDEHGLAARALTSLGINVDLIRAQVVQVVGSGEEASPGAIPFTPRAKKVLELGLREALSLGDNVVGTEHILLGLAHENEGVASRILLDRGVTAQSIRNQVMGLLPTRPRPQAAPGATAWGRQRQAIDPGWLDGLAPLLDRMASEIRHELHRSPDSGDLLLALACAQDGLTGRALSAMGVDLDQLWGTIERLRTEASSARDQLRGQIQEVSRAKEQAIEAQQFDRAAELRNQERELRERQLSQAAVPIDEALDALLRHLGIPRSRESTPPG